jgi:hypothetical protein
MLRVEDCKGRKTTREGHRFLGRKDKKNDRLQTDKSSRNFLAVPQAENVRKSVEERSRKAKSGLRSKKPKFITDDIEKSSQDCLGRSFQSQRREEPPKLCLANEDDNVYQLCKTVRKQATPAPNCETNGKREGKKQQNSLASLNKIKVRMPKTSSKEHRQSTTLLSNPLHLRSKDKSRSNKKGQQKATRQSATSPNNNFLSPEVVESENSYYFAACNQISVICPPENRQPSPRIIPTAKKESRYIFESRGDVWKEVGHRSSLLGSTVDLLN